MPKKESLKNYQKKRNFTKTPEPSGVKIKKKKTKKPIFVIQKHAASHLHYDLRLEIEDVLVSWAVPKGPSTNPKEKRLAMRTEDHPIDYANFEGVIPEGQYGAGTVMVWDYGTYKNIKKKGDKLVPMEQCLKNGQIEVWLYGKKLQGGYVLHLFKKDEDAWLLIKMKDDKADARRNPTSTENKSALTNRTMTEIKREEE
jgi:DNA ligase D-like protein (predicted 3'-phosphoesterase)